MQIQSENRAWTLLVIVLSLLVAAMINVYPLTANYAMYRPLALMMVLIYWSMYRPQYVGVFFAFLVGLSADLLSDTLLGQQAFSALLATFVVRLGTHYFKDMTAFNTWILSCLSMSTFLVSLWALQYITESYVMTQSWWSLLVSIICWPFMVLFFKIFVR